MSMRIGRMVLVALACGAAVWAQVPQTQPARGPATTRASQPARKPLTWQTLYGEKPVNFSGRYARIAGWLDEGHWLEWRKGRLTKVAALTGKAEPAYDVTALESALRATGEFDDQAARDKARRPDVWSADRSCVLIRHHGHLYLYRFARRRVTRITRDERPRRVVGLTRSGRYAIFVCHNDLYAIETSTRRLRRLTRDGSPTRLNGVLDWVYQEEIYGRGHWRGWWASPDERHVAFLQLDETGVPVYRLVNPLEAHPHLQPQYYPRAGETNPRVRLGIADLATGRLRWVDLKRYGRPMLITHVSFDPDGHVVFCVQDREQTWLDLNVARPASGRVTRLLRETGPAWVATLAPPVWLADGSFLWLSERDGWRHLYRIGADGRRAVRLTRGDWEIRSLYGVDRARQWAYFSATRDSRLENHAYRLSLQDGRIERLTDPGFSHRVQFNPGFSLFVDTYSNLTTPPQVALRFVDGALARVVSENRVEALEQYVLSKPRLVWVPARDGFRLHAMILRPPVVESGRRYPLWCEVYGGPGAQTVWNAWSGSRMMADQLLASQGVIILRTDPRSASGAGAVWRWQVYRRLGRIELRDIEDAVRWVLEHEPADADRVGITGHSYGGFMTTYALTHSEMFSVGIAGAPVTDWHNYDAVYTERYMQTPQHNIAGYEASSVWKAAKDLHGRLLVAHGSIDDNVHFQNTAQLIDALENHEKIFDMVLYPRDRHGFGHGYKHWRRLRWEYLRQHLRLAESR